MTPDLTLRDTADGCIFPVRVHPGARKNAITGVHDGALKVSLSAPPTDGRANDALIAFIAERMHVPRSRVTLVSGTTSRTKTLRISAKSAAEVRTALSDLL